MTPTTQAVVLAALDQALAAHVARLFQVLMAGCDANAVAPFWAGLNRSIALHEELRRTIAADERPGAA
jgi:hypothetical protein